MIVFENVSKSFNSGTPNEILALKNLDLKIKKGEFVVMIGSNGSGKSTVLNVIAGSAMHDKGQIHIDEFDVSRLPEHKRSRWIARIFQNPLAGTAPNMSIVDNFRLAALRSGKKGLHLGVDRKFKNRVRESVSYLEMGLENRLDQKAGSLSGGQRQALTLMMAVMDEAKVILLDEPTAALDPRSSEVLLKTTASVIEMYQLTAIFVTHQLKDAYNYGNRLIQMQEGLIIRDLDYRSKQETPLAEYFKWFA